MAVKSKARKLTPIGVGFTHLFDCQVVEYLKDRKKRLSAPFLCMYGRKRQGFGTISFFEIECLMAGTGNFRLLLVFLTQQGAK